jgi:hypothetical protein
MIAQGSHECAEPLRFQLGRSFRYPTAKLGRDLDGDLCRITGDLP